MAKYRIKMTIGYGKGENIFKPGSTEDVPEIADNFDKMQKRFNLSADFISKVNQAGFKRPTPVQMQTLPIVFSGRNAIILAETGSGKSLAFLTPLLHLHKRGDGLKALVVAPTRELAIQLYKECLMFSKQSKTNDEGSARVRILRKALTPKTEKQFEEFMRSSEILISTPLKLANLMKQFQFRDVKHLIVDEADKMFEMGFLEQIETVFTTLKDYDVSKYLFSATMQTDIEQVVQKHMDGKQPILKVQIGVRNTTANSVKQRLVYCGNEDGKLATLRQEMAEGYEPPLLIFVQSKDRAK